MSMRNITEKGLDLIKLFEGFSPTMYRCPAGYRTIGYGHLVKVIESYKFYNGISIDYADELLRDDLQTAQRGVFKWINVPLTDGQYDALVSFTFNLGSGALQASTLRKVINRYDYESVPKQFRRWVYARGRKLNGLIRRRESEINLYNSY
jgi:lysozyme